MTEIVRIFALFGVVLILVLLLALLIFITVLIIRALLKYLKGSDVRKEKTVIKKSLGAVLKDYRTKSGMTQEFVAESVGVSRQAVSKWESGVSEPSTSNLIALSKLYNISAEELFGSIEDKK